MTCKEILDFYKDEKYDSKKITFCREWGDKTYYYKLKVNFAKFDTYTGELTEKLKLFVNVANVSKEECMTVADLKELAKKCCEMAGDDSYIIFTSDSTKPRLSDCYITECNVYNDYCVIDDYDPDVMESDE
jgi:hypothetical protein